ncbi:hypothetical protein LY625_03790 [Lysobacter sp. GX 14042]|uniref:glycosyltransferase family 9 protein n=1 Tax=Lysobacter sp. GX 14042 TaxID=2907155 RepID=UPI001F2B608E|nr:glycosyltransferase family 9 protein [Lysobacter sp. GX 14042]MCE7031746.1 hypothetical protein [Lysobacter sp. GX 14042]
MIFDLRAGHLGDVLLAMPAMREGDAVIAQERARVPGLGVQWRAGGSGIRPVHGQGRHATDAWLLASSREPVRHTLLPDVPRDLLVIAPVVESPRRRWHGWAQLARLLGDVVWLGATEARQMWMETLNRAHTVICPDTGTAHMADALGVPKVVGLYGGAMDRFAPYWNRAHCIERPRMAMTPAEVAEVVRAQHV